MADDNAEEQVEEVGSGGKKKLIIFIVLAIVLLGGAGAATFLLLGSEEPVAEENAEPAVPVKQAAEYLPLGDAFVVDFNVKGKQRFLQLYITVMARDSVSLDAVSTHLPLIRNNLNLVIGGDDFEVLKTVAGKEALRLKILDSIQQALDQESEGSKIESVLFTNFVMQ